MKAGTPEWWEVVHTSPMYEAETLMRRYKAALLADHPPGSPGYVHVGVTIQHINDEIHRLGQVQNRARLSTAVRSICGQEVYEQVMAESARLEQMARLPDGRF